MAITNYTELRAAVASWVHRSDLTSQIPDFITLGEARINRELSARFAEAEGALTASVGSRYIALPARFKRAYELWLTTYNPRTEIIYRTPETIPVSTSQGVPRYYTVDGANIAFDCPANSAHTFTLRYKKGFDIAADTTNDLLTNHAGLYLFATLCEAAIYIRDDVRLAMWEGRYQSELAETQRFESQNKGMATLRVDVGLSGNRGNIIDGY